MINHVNKNTTQKTNYKETLTQQKKKTGAAESFRTYKQIKLQLKVKTVN